MSQAKLHVKKGDTVLVLSGKDKGKQGKILQAMPAKDKVVVEGVNKIKRHTKPNQKAPNGGIIEKEAPMFASKVMVVCPACSKATRVAKKEIDGKRYLSWEQCKEMQDSGLVEIFSHSKRHVFYDRLPVRMIRDDVIESYKIIEENLGYKWLK